MQSQQSTLTADAALWAVEDGEALRLDIGPGDRELHVTQGRLWLTREGSALHPAEDLWLAAGDTLALASGSEWVVEAWGASRFQLLVPPSACARQARRLSVSLWGRPASSLLPALG
ncbi:MAG: DUF2917 domain-containing protein [Rhizobacter sp.]|nr:DUF2917 domain-containing protein [Rhizobacter sp.]